MRIKGMLVRESQSIQRNGIGSGSRDRGVPMHILASFRVVLLLRAQKSGIMDLEHELVAYSREELMRLLITNLLICSILMTPLGVFFTPICCDGTGIPSSVSFDASVIQDWEDDCCAPAEPTEKQPDAPCNESECPKSCCAMVASSVFVPPHESRVTLLSACVVVDKFYDAGDRSPAHLDRLKRPPRSV